MATITNLETTDDGATSRTTINTNTTNLNTDKEEASNKQTAFQTTPDDTAYPSEKLVKDSLDDKLEKAGDTMTGKLTTAGKDEVAKTYTPATGAQTVTLDCEKNNVHQVTGHADGTTITFAVSNVTNSQPFIVIVEQGAVASTIAGWFNSVKWAGGEAPTLTPTADKTDTFGFIRIGADSYLGFVIGQNS